MREEQRRTEIVTEGRKWERFEEFEGVITWGQGSLKMAGVL